MNDTPHHKHPADREPPMPSETELLASLTQSDAELAAGQIVSGDEVLRELDESIARMGAKRAGRTPGPPPVVDRAGARDPPAAGCPPRCNACLIHRLPAGQDGVGTQRLV